jgi:hypothetical protein
MFLSAGILCIVVAGVSSLAVARIKRQRDESEIGRHTITAEQLHRLFSSSQEVFLFDVRQPLDLLAYPRLFLGHNGFHRKSC